MSLTHVGAFSRPGFAFTHVANHHPVRADSIHMQDLQLATRKPCQRLESILNPILEP